MKNSSPKSLSANSRPTLGQQITDMLPTVGRQLADKRLAVDRQSADCWSTVDRLLVGGAVLHFFLKFYLKTNNAFKMLVIFHFIIDHKKTCVPAFPPTSLNNNNNNNNNNMLFPVPLSNYCPEREIKSNAHANIWGQTRCSMANAMVGKILLRLANNYLPSRLGSTSARCTLSSQVLHFQQSKTPS